MCLYRSGKLCLSPFDYYQEHEKDSHKIERLKENGGFAISKFETIIKEILMQYEVPTAYKNIEDVIASVEDFNLAEKIATFRPLGLIVER